ncbi:hypothetical protein ACO0QE_002038 [Hanseniaspora vineae]
MLYELVALVRTPRLLTKQKYEEAKEVAFTAGKLVLENRGVVRRVIPMGQSFLPKTVKKNQEEHFESYNFLMLFDASAGVQTEILRSLRKDPRVIRSNIMKVDTSKTYDVTSSIEMAQGKSSLLDIIKDKAL